MTLRHLQKTDGSWDQLVRQWQDACVSFGEEFEDYACDALPVLEELIEEAPPADRARVVSLFLDGHYQAVCQVNRTHLPGYDGMVLRVRHLVLSPRLDFGDRPLEDYERVLTELLDGILKLSETEMVAPHIKFHFRSPADRQFFKTLRDSLERRGVFRILEMRGAWLYITK